MSDQLQNSDGRRLFIGNLAFTATWQDVKDHFGGNAFAKVLPRGDGSSSGCGVVEFATADEAQAAIAQFQGTELQGRRIFCRLDRRQKRDRQQRRKLPVAATNNATSTSSVYVGNLPWSVTVDQVRELVESAAPSAAAARRIGFPVDHKDRSRGFAIVEMNSTKDADILIAALDGRELGKRKLHVRFDQFSEK